MMDEDGDPRTTETDEDGVFSFSQVAVDTVYLLKPEGTDLYTVVRNGNPKIGSTKEETTDVVPHALVTAPSTLDLEKIKVGTPSWDGHTSTANGEMDNDFVLLYKNGDIEGTVSDPSVRAAHEHATVELRLCKTTDYRPAVVDPPSDEVPLTKCTAYTDYEKEAEVDEDGEWLAEDLREGVWEVVVDLPAGYVHVSESGGDDEAADADTYFSKQIAELNGGRASGDTKPFHIKDDNAGDGAEFTSLTIDGTTCEVAGNERCADNKHDDATISVVLTASRGATVRLSSSATVPTPTGTGTYSAAVTNGKATNVTLPTAGSRLFHIHIAAEDGYSTNRVDQGTAREVENFTVRRDSDTRLNLLSIQWGGDRIDLNRRDLGLDPGNPDGETAPVTGVTTLNVTLDKGKGGAVVPTTPLTIVVVGKNPKFDAVTFAALEEAGGNANTGTFPACDDTIDGAPATGTITVEANATGTETTGKGEGAICIRITDNNEAADPDTNADNMNTYRLILTRK